MSRLKILTRLVGKKKKGELKKTQEDILQRIDAPREAHHAGITRVKKDWKNYKKKEGTQVEETGKDPAERST